MNDNNIILNLKITTIDNGYILYYQQTTNHELFFSSKEKLLERIATLIME